MAGPWEKYQQPTASGGEGPWKKYQSAEDKPAPNTGLFASGPLSFMQPVDDFTTAAMDSFTRGLGNKLFGQGAQQEAQNATERLGNAAVPAEIAGAVAGMPYRVGSTAMGAGIGGVEGGLSAYGHQPNWIPSAEDDQQILQGTLKGAAFGGLGAKAGEWLGKGWSALSGRNVPNPQAGDPNLLRTIGNKVEPLSLGGGKSAQHFPAIAVTESVLAHLGIPPGVTTAGATALNWLGKTPLGSQPATLANPAVTGATRDALAKMMITYGGTP